LGLRLARETAETARRSLAELDTACTMGGAEENKCDASSAMVFIV
jgi:hypothetical protein